MSEGGTTTSRRRASHCVELTGRQVGGAAPAVRFTEAGGDLARALAAPLGGLLAGARLRIACSAQETLPVAALQARIGPVAASSVLEIPGLSTQVLVSIALGDLLGVTDRAFGGEGEIPEQLPEELPLTADLVAAQVEEMMARALGVALPDIASSMVASRAADIARLDPFGRHEECHSFTLTVTQVGYPDWTILIAMCPESFALLFAARPKAAAAVARRDPLAGPLADMPIALEAVVAEFALPLARLTRLAPGDTIPLTLTREIPLKILETTIAYGSIGAAEERAALQLTRVF